MSTQTIETRVVEMKFDNKEFEANVQTSMSTLDKLKAALNLPTASKGIDGIQSAINNLGFTSITTSIEKISSGFSALETIAAGALQQIGASAVTAGKQLLDSFTIDPIKDGFSEYELKMDSVQTIMSGTGESLDVVMDKLNELNTYADKTIYSFSDMTSSIGKFTNNGVKLDAAVSAIQGVSNLAAVSGANAQQASHAMYNFAQALSSGSVKLIDWNSIENANMATTEFKNELLKTAVAMGTVTEKEGKFVSTTTNAKGQVSDAFDAVSGFNDSLNHGWMTTDVLTATLAKYSDETTELGKKAYAAAQDVKTFTQLMDTLKEAVGSGWAETWEYVFGNFDEAKELWSGVNDVLSNFIGAQSDARNSLLKNWKELGGRTELIKALINIFNTLGKVMKAAGQAFEEIFPPITGLQLETLTRQFLDFTKKMKMSKDTFKDIKSVFKGLFAAIDILITPFKLLGVVFLDVIKYFTPFSKGVLDCAARLGDYLVALRETIKQTSSDFLGSEEYERLKKVLEPLAKIFEAFSKFMHDSFINLIDWAERSQIVIRVLGALGYGLIYAAEQVKHFCEYVYNLPGVQKFITELKKRFDDFINNFTFEKAEESIKSFYNRVKEALINLKNNFTLENVRKQLKLFVEYLKTKLQAGQDYLVDFGKQAGVSLGKVKKFLGDNLGSIVAILSGIGLIKAMGALKKIFEAISNPFELVESLFEHFGKLIDAIALEKKANAMIKMAIAIGILALSLALLSRIDVTQLIPAAIALGVLIGALIGTSIALKKLSDANMLETGKELGAGFLMLSGALAIMVLCMKMLETMTPAQIAGGLLVLAVLGAGLLGFSFVLSKIGTKELVKSTITLTSFSLSLLVLTKALNKISKIKTDNILTSLLMLGIATAALAAVTFAASKADTGSALTVLAAAVSLLIVATVMERLASFNYKKQEKALKLMGSIFMIMVGLMYASGKLGVAKSGAGFLAMAASLVIIIQVIKVLGKMKLGDLIKGTIAVGYLIIVMGIFAAITKLFSGGGAKIGLTLLGLAAALMAAAIAVTILSKLDPDGLKRGVLALLALMGGMALIVGITALSKDFEKTMLMIAVTIGVLAIALGGLSMIDPSKLQGATVALVAVMGVMAILVASTGIASTKALPTLVVLTLIVSGLAFILYKMSELNVSNVLPIAQSLSMLILSLSAACILLGIAGTFGATGLIGIGVMSALVVAIGGLLLLLGEVFSHIDNYEQILDTGITVLEKIGIALGKFAMSFATGVTSALPLIGANLAAFGTSLKPFILTLKSADADALNGAKLLAETILVLAGASFIDGLSEFIFGSSPMSEMAKRLSDFMGELGPFIEGLNGIKPSAAVGAEHMANAVATLTKSSFSENIQNLIPGFDSNAVYQDFAEGLVTLGKGLADFSNELGNGYDSDLVATSAKSIAELAEVGKKLPNNGGLVGMIVGNNDWTTFGTGLKEFGEAMTGYSESVKDLDAASVEASLPVASSLSDLAKKLPNSGGLISIFAGNNDWTTFGTGLTGFGEAMRDYSKVVSEMSKDDIDAAERSVKIGTSLSDLANSIPNSGGLLSKFTGDNDWSTFGEGLVEFGSTLRSYSISVTGIHPEAVTNSVTAAKGVVTIADYVDNIADIDNESVGNVIDALTGLYENGFMYKIVYFGNAIKQYYECVEGINTSKLSESLNAFSSIKSSSLSSFSDWLNKISGEGANFSGSLTYFGDSIRQFYAKVENLSNKKLDKVTASMEKICDLSKKISSLNVDKVASNLQKYGESISGFGNSINDFDTSSVSKELDNLNKEVKKSSKKSSGKDKLGSEWAKEISSSADAAKKEASKGGTSIVDQFTKGMESKASEVTKAGKSTTEFSIKGAKSKIGEMKKIGGHAGEGYVSGVKSKLDDAYRAGWSLGKKTQQGTKDAQKSASPSKEFMKLGKYAGQGYVAGILSYASNVEAAGSTIGRTAIDATRSTIRDLANAISEDMDTTPTIRPVLDLSDVQAGASSINRMLGSNYNLGAIGNLGAIQLGMQEIQNGPSTADMVDAIHSLREDLANLGGDSYTINGITYDDGSNITEAIRTLTHAALMERRV